MEPMEEEEEPLWHNWYHPIPVIAGAYQVGAVGVLLELDDWIHPEEEGRMGVQGVVVMLGV